MSEGLSGELLPPRLISLSERGGEKKRREIKRENAVAL